MIGRKTRRSTHRALLHPGLFSENVPDDLKDNDQT
jgi:hypothetical protein